MFATMLKIMLLIFLMVIHVWIVYSVGADIADNIKERKRNRIYDERLDLKTKIRTLERELARCKRASEKQIVRDWVKSANNEHKSNSPRDEYIPNSGEDN